VYGALKGIGLYSVMRLAAALNRTPAMSWQIRIVTPSLTAHRTPNSR
jgi:hypothetical protein